jgi:hypothetical protein
VAESIALPLFTVWALAGRRLAPDFLKKEQGPRRSIDALNLSTESDQAQGAARFYDVDGGA